MLRIALLGVGARLDLIEARVVRQWRRQVAELGDARQRFGTATCAREEANQLEAVGELVGEERD